MGVGAVGGRSAGGPAVVSAGAGSYSSSSSSSYANPPIIVSPVADHDAMRGRRRDRSVTRASARGALRCAPSDESSTLRGRSRRRATSSSRGSGYTAAAAAAAAGALEPRVLSPGRRHHLLHAARLRREHCPSRVASPAEQQHQQRSMLRRQRTRSRSRGARLDRDPESPRLGEVLSKLRNEVLPSAGQGSEDEPDEV